MNSPKTDLGWDERTSALELSPMQTGGVFECLFERTSDAIYLFDPEIGMFVDCNQAGVDLVGAKSKSEVLRARPEDFSPSFQPDGRPSREMTEEIVALVETQKCHRFEWTSLHRDGHEIPLEVLVTQIQMGGRKINVSVARDISTRKKAERDLLELNQSLERRVSERTAELSASEARFRALLEHAPEAIVVYNVEAGRFLFGNQHACDLYGVPMSKLPELSPADVSPEFQPCGGRTSDLVREKISEVLSGGIAVFEWLHKRADGRLIPAEVRLLRLPADGQTLIRASIIDNTERKRAERALRESEAKFRALFEGASQGVLLRDEHQFLEVNPAAVRILGRQSAGELLGTHPVDFSPPFQPGGESSAALARKYTEECMAQGCVRFDWLACDPRGREIPIEVSLTRIEWGGRQLIQGFISDISERKRAQAALAESEARFSVAFQASPALIGVLRQNDGAYVMANDAFVNWLGYPRENVIGHSSAEFGMWVNHEERESALNTMRTQGSIRDRECRWRNRHGETLTVLLSAETIQVHHEPHILSFAIDITRRKQAEAELRETEARFSAAFQASPALIGILRVSDGKYVLANDAHLNWLGYSLEEICGRTCLELGLWEDPRERDAVLKDMQSAGSIRQRECRWRNRRGKLSTMLLSVQTIQLNNLPHMLVMALDITHRKRAEEELRKNLEREKELSQLKSNFVSMVSHEFRTPLGIIQSSAELLRDFQERMGPDERKEQLESVSRNARRMAGMMEEVLVLSRLDAGRLNFQPAALDLNAFCRRVVDEVLSATSRRCAIELSLDSIPAEAQADEQLLGHIFTNLLSNAVKYSEAGAVVRFRVARDGGDAVCVIRDQGIGIPEADQPQLFLAFHRGSNVGTRPGTGLGLLLVKRCADLHGGQVQVESKPDEGTTVTVRLPVF